MFPTVITSRNVFLTVITYENMFPTVMTSGNNCAWADATTCFIETLTKRSRTKQNIVNSTWTWWDVVYLAELCVLIFAVLLSNKEPMIGGGDSFLILQHPNKRAIVKLRFCYSVKKKIFQNYQVGLMFLTKPIFFKKLCYIIFWCDC